MNGDGFSLAQSLRLQVSPVVMVLPTPLVEESCRKNSLSFVDLLRPFCSIANVNVPVRTASEQPYRLQEFHLRMLYATEICQPRAEIAEEYLLQVVRNSIGLSANELSAGQPQMPEVARMIAESKLRESFFVRYNREFMRTVAFSEHEAVDHPVACLQVVSSRDKNPLSKFVDVFNTDQLPALLNEGAMDPKLVKLYVLLHDNQDGSVDRANEILLGMRSTFGVSNCRVLCINSGSASDPIEDMWTPHLLSPYVPEEADKLADKHSESRLGCYINKTDAEELADFIMDLSIKHIIPSMELKIRTLYQQVSATRKGLKNQIKNLWWRKGKEDIPDVSSGPMYTFASMESQIRVLADYAFMLNDFELALSNYRLLSSDYKADKAWKRFAGVQEMIGLSVFMIDQSKRDSEFWMEQAISYYQKCGSSGAKYATRASIWLGEMHKARLQYREAAIVLSRASTEETSSRAGLLLEQAACCYLYAVPPMLRKYGFNLVQAGNQYALCGQRKLALHMYRNALSVCEGQGWNYISDHVHFHLGRLSAFLGYRADAVQFFMKLIASSHQSAANQATFLSEFLFMIQHTEEMKCSLQLPLPSVNVQYVHVHFEDHRTYASSAAASLGESVWSALEEGLIPTNATTVSTWLDAKRATVGLSKDFNICVAGEEIGVDVEFSNPLHISLDVSAASLVCEFDAEIATGDSGVVVSTGSLCVNSVSACQTSGCMPDKGVGNRTSFVVFHEEAFSLAEAQKVVVRLKVNPMVPGVLKVVGVRWLLAGIAAGRRDFALLGPKNPRSRNQSRDELPPHMRLKFHVLGQMPRLDVSLHEFPGKVNAGEVRRLVLELSNPSSAALKAIKLKTSHPYLILVGDSGDLDNEFPGCLEVQREASALSNIKDAGICDPDSASNGFVFSFPESISLEGGSTLLWPLWLHARQASTLSLNTVMYYEPDKAPAGLKFRTVRMTHKLQVLPSLRVVVQISPSPLQLKQFLLRLDIENQHASESFWLRQVSCAGNQWRLAPLPPPVVDGRTGSESGGGRAAFLSASVCPSQLLPASQHLSLFFKLLNVGSLKLPSTDEVTSNIKLGPPSSTEPLIDIASGPLLGFLLREKLQQSRFSQPTFVQLQGEINKEKDKSSIVSLGEGGAVDVILISEQQEGVSMEKQAPSLQETVRIGSHNICHCSVQGSTPLVWVLEGPKHIGHDFGIDPFCKVPLSLTVRNCSNFNAFIKVETFDSKPIPTALSSSNPLQEKRVGWFPLKPVSSTEDSAISTEPATSNSINWEEGLIGISPCRPYVWCTLRLSLIPLLKPGASAKVPLHVLVFSPGIYDLSSYQIRWTLEYNPSPKAESKPSTSLVSKLGNTTEATFASGCAPVPDKNAITSGNENNLIYGVGLGHPLALTVSQSS